MVGKGSLNNRVSRKTAPGAAKTPRRASEARPAEGAGRYPVGSGHGVLLARGAAGHARGGRRYTDPTASSGTKKVFGDTSSKRWNDEEALEEAADAILLSCC